jgi:hypothetical protein
MHESIPGVTTPPPGICPIDRSRGSGICLSSFHARARGPGIVVSGVACFGLLSLKTEKFPSVISISYNFI